MLCMERHYYQSKKTTHRMIENVFQIKSDKGLISRILQRTPKTQHKNKQPNSKMVKEFEESFFQRRYTNGQ